MRLLLDTHIVIRLTAQPERLSRRQRQAIERETENGNHLAISDISLLEIAALTSPGSRLALSTRMIFEALDRPDLRIIPVTFEIAEDVGTLGKALRDPYDRAIVATARVHNLQLVTSDQAIIESNLVRTID